MHMPSFTPSFSLVHTFHPLLLLFPLSPSSLLPTQHRLAPDLSTAIQALSAGKTYKGPVTPHLSEGIVSSMTLWARRSLLLCTLGGSTVVHVMSLLTGEAITTFAGHIGVLTCVAINPTHGLIFTGAVIEQFYTPSPSQFIPYQLTPYQSTPS